MTKVPDEFGEGTEGKVDFLKGQVALVIFWQSTCTQSIKALTQCQRMFELNKEAWSSKVRILAFNVDEDIKAVQDLVKSEKFSQLEHFHVRNGVCNAQVLFSALVTPLCLLIDRDTKLVFNGHFLQRNLEEDIANLLSNTRSDEVNILQEPPQ